VNALTADAEGVGDTLLRIGGERAGFRVGVQAQHLEVARHFMHGEAAGRRLAVDQDFAAIGIDQFARDTRSFLRRTLGIADHHFDLTAGQTAGGVDLFDFEHHGVARRGAELRDAARQNRRHADLDRLAGGARDHRRGQGADGQRRRALKHGAPVEPVVTRSLHRISSR